MKRRALVALAIVLLASSAQAAPDFFGLGAVFPGYPSAAGNVSADGTTVVGMSQVPAGSVAFRWRAGALTNLGDLPFGDVQAMAYDVSGNGAFVVGQGNGIAGNEAFRSTLGLISGLGDLPDFDGVFRSAAYGISADGGTIVGVGYGDSGQEAFRWAGGVMTGLGDLPGGNFESTAFDVSANGATIVGEGFGELGHEAFLWTGGVMTGLGTIAGGTAGSAALGVSGDGATVVGYGYNDPFSPEAMRWTSATGMVGLGDLAGGSFYSLARATSADGSIIVGNGTNAAGQEAILWDIAPSTAARRCGRTRARHARARSDADRAGARTQARWLETERRGGYLGRWPGHRRQWKEPRRHGVHVDRHHSGAGQRDADGLWSARPGVAAQALTSARARRAFSDLQPELSPRAARPTGAASRPPSAAP